jgi:hypothetical protein
VSVENTGFVLVERELRIMPISIKLSLALGYGVTIGLFVFLDHPMGATLAAVIGVMHWRLVWQRIATAHLLARIKALKTSMVMRYSGPIRLRPNCAEPRET